MRIGIDARFYGSLGKGLGRYVAELISALESCDDRNEYVIFLRQTNFDAYTPKNPGFSKVLAEFPWYGWKEQLIYPFWLRKFRIDLMHFPHFNVPLLYRRPFVVTIHDLILLQHPTTRATTLGPLLFGIKFALYRVVIAHAILRARRVITVSEWSKADIIAHFPTTQNKNIAVTYEAVSKEIACGTTICHPGQAQRDPGSTEQKKPFALYVGNAYPHKNLDRLIEAFTLFRKDFHDHRLVLVGAPDYFHERLEREAKEKKLDAGVTFYGHATDEQLAELYDTASFYVFPSLHEGFGLPALEAMAHGLPVASSNATCLPEILGDAALYFDPKDPHKIADAMRTLASDATLRATLIAKGKERVTHFDWADCGKRTLAIYRETLAD